MQFSGWFLVDACKKALKHRCHVNLCHGEPKHKNIDEINAKIIYYQKYLMKLFAQESKYITFRSGETFLKDASALQPGKAQILAPNGVLGSDNMEIFRQIFYHLIIIWCHLLERHAMQRFLVTQGVFTAFTHNSMYLCFRLSSPLSNN